MVSSIFGACETSIFETMSLLAAAHKAINLGQGFPEALEPPDLIEAAVAALRQGPHQYPPMMGLPDLRQAVAENAQRFFGLAVDWEREVLVTSGATEALCDAFLGLLDPGDEVIVFEPVYDSYGPIIRRAGAVAVPIRLEPPHWGLPRERLIEAIGPRTRAIVVNTPMNPIGKIFDADELGFIADCLLKHGLVAIADEVYEHLVFDGRRHLSLFALPNVRDRVVRIGSAGKTFSVTGWKVGYIIADARLLTPIARAHQFITFTTPPALQAAVASGLRMPDSYFEGLKATLQQRRDFLARSLQTIGFDVQLAPATYFSIASFRGLELEADDLSFCRRMTLEAGVTAIPLSPFYSQGDRNNLIRLCFAKSLETLEEAVSRLKRWKSANLKCA